MADQIKTPKGITLDRYLDAVRAGTHDAVAEMLRGEGHAAAIDEAMIQRAIDPDMLMH